MVNYKKIGKLLLWRCRQKKQLEGPLPQATAAPNQEVEDAPLVLLPCVSCKRTFRPEALAKHSKVCEKTLMKKRKTFDSSKQRLQGTEVESFATSPPVAKAATRKSRTKEKLDLEKAIQAVKRPPPDPNPLVRPSDHDECPHCGRFFGPKAFERHTQFCKEQQLKLKSTPTVSQEAKERLKVRTSYKGPLTNKVLNRDRYQPKRDPSPMSSEHRDDTSRSRGLTRNASLRSSFRSRASDTTPPPPLRRTMTQISSTRSRRSREKEEVTASPQQEVDSQRQGMPRLYSREHPDRKDAEKYNPYLSAERQMMELFSGDDEVKSKSPTVLPEIPISSPLQSSPTSAFVKYSSPGLTLSRDSLNNENNNICTENDKIVSMKQSDDFIRHDNLGKPNNFSLSSLSLCSVVSLESVDCNRNTKSVGRPEELQRSFSALEGKTRTRNKVNLREMLYGAGSPEEQAPQSEGSNSDPGNLETCEAELLISMLEFEKMLKSSPLPSLESSPTLCSSMKVEEISKHLNNETEKHKNFRNISHNSIDSAYSSLTRSAGGGEGEPAQTELPSFCHECGTRYPVITAKFCCNCGMKRIVL